MNNRTLVQPTQVIQKLNWTFYYFKTEVDAQAWETASTYRTQGVSLVSMGLYEVAEHYYDKKA